MYLIKQTISHTRLGIRCQPDTLHPYHWTDKSFPDIAHEEDIFNKYKTQSRFIHLVGRHLIMACSRNYRSQVKLSFNAHTWRAGTHMSQ
jgi:hypothetical protein